MASQNYFASCLLLPKSELKKEVMLVLDELEIKNKGVGIIYLDIQPCNITNYLVILNRLKTIFQVSETVVRIRLEELGLLNDTRPLNTQHPMVRLS